VIRGMPPASPFQSPQKRDVTGRVTLVATAPKTKPVKVSPANTVVDFKEAAQQITDLIVPGETIRHFLEIDLGALDSLPSGSRDLIALSLRVGRAFDTLCCRVFDFVAQEHEIPPRAREAVATELALDFIERYGALAFFSTNLIRVLWTEQRLPVAHGAKRLQEVGKRLAIFARAQKGDKPSKSIDIGFALFKPDFLEELQELSRELGDSTSDKPRAEQMLDLVGTGKYLMLERNLSWLEQFLRSQDINPYLNEQCATSDAKNALSADLLAEYGIGRSLGEEREYSITPEWFFYTWMAWVNNKTPKTVSREIKTAKTNFKKKIDQLIRVTKNR
jgi:hypothetical protein